MDLDLLEYVLLVQIYLALPLIVRCKLLMVRPLSSKDGPI